MPQVLQLAVYSAAGKGDLLIACAAESGKLAAVPAVALSLSGGAAPYQTWNLCSGTLLTLSLAVRAGCGPEEGAGCSP